MKGRYYKGEYRCDDAVLVFPIERHYYDDEGETPYINYGCPVCESVAGRRIGALSEGIENCPTCRVKICWDKQKQE